ncbi:MAG: hypothetical protein A3E31_17095 [Candidatus Rokubacteria bacterium RIFCSPHIGHO2_12_FULL_73_22]|nr:MAG: hypothetical protein A3D33_17255 [Candidatus Rokubacteria bacterium RIFCSPHIGHO2_02_FULL_73_26]OGL01474.1 MAG: hypothetical protein A3E31_17095 [Candidatus Rokubacteria bacterium RIFCSPHIGHO2_12_FULL_73_22]OGL11048.1 MAG: hypothetical protein A3I14_11340 [Candidatus Rokubacteria bacterium RIFCSPLOWO2_02_FULL_73_56]OGL24883.1 MAG: hypothetical protein A3G44_17245 [Candidatus Rokubacteria bacterium RIFCSPLOWO2_12_FULL_73_47]
MANRVFWSCWLAASVLTGVVAGFMLGHALILARFLDWLLASGLLARTYPVFRGSAGRAGLDAYYAVAGLQVLAVLAFAAVALAARRHRAAAVVAAVAGALWVVVHYASGFGALEAAVLQGAAEAPAEVAARFRAWNAPIHLVHAGTLLVALLALLGVPLAALRRRR